MNYSLKIFSDWLLPIDLWFDEQIDLYVDKIDQDFSNHKKIILLVEPDELTHFSDWIINNHERYFAILTHEEKILRACPNAYLMEFGTTWIHEYSFPLKEFSVSTILGFKRILAGHRLRKKLWDKRKKITLPKKFFASGEGPRSRFPFLRLHKRNELILGNSKFPLFDSQFHIAIENTKQNNWFTEKLIDCFQTKTIPIYWGCPNIGKYFDVRGMFLACDVNEIVKICNSLTPHVYFEMLPFIEKNYELSKKYVDIKDRITNKVKELVLSNKHYEAGE